MDILFTNPAKSALKEIYDNYEQTGKKPYAQQLRKNIFAKCKLLVNHPEMGAKEPMLIFLGRNHRFLLESHYKIIYRVIGEVIYVTDIFDTRQNPNKLITRNRKI